jgi:septal ring factor EnvC (AmiA/AmiB activator)
MKTTATKKISVLILATILMCIVFFHISGCAYGNRVFPKKKEIEKKTDVSKSYEKTIAYKDKEIQLLKSRVKEMEKEIKKLTHQLSSLEAIDKNIKQKMTEIE